MRFARIFPVKLPYLTAICNSVSLLRLHAPDFPFTQKSIAANSGGLLFPEEMGCTASLPSAEEFLQEFKPPDSEYCDGLTSSTQNIDLVVQQKLFSWSGGDFKVKDTSGKDYCVVQGKVMSMRDRIVILDTSGNEIACCLEKVFSMSPAMFVYGFKPYFAGQNPTKETQNGKPLYAWAKV